MLKSDPKFMACLVGKMITQLMAILFNIYMLLWITSFVDSGLMKDEAEGKVLYQSIIVFSFVFVALLTPVFGVIADKLPGAVIVPITFALRCVIGFNFLQIEDPRLPWSIIICCLYVIISLQMNISVETLFLKGIPADIRGTMLGLFWFFAMLGILLFTVIGGNLYDRVGPAAPFGGLLVVDGLFFVVMSLLGLCGLIKE